MAVQQHNIVKTEQVEAEVYVEIGSNKATGTYVYITALAGWVNTLPMAGSTHPDYPALYLKSIRANRQEGSMMKVLCSYESFSAEASYPGRPAGAVVRYDMELSTSEEPLLSHPKFNSLDSEEKFLLAELLAGNLTEKEATKVKDKIKSDAGEEAVRLIQKGTTGYLNPTLTWVARYSANNVSGLAGNLGKKNSPMGSPPSSGSRDYIYIGASARGTDDGKGFEIERRWTLSGLGGADDYLYG